MNLSRRDRTILFLIVALFILTPDRSSLNSGWLSDGGLEWELEQRNALFNSSFKHPGNFTGVDFELPEQVSRLVDMLNDGPGPRFSNISSTGKLKWNRLDLENVAHDENDTYPSLITAEAGLLNLFLSSRGEEEEIKQLKARITIANNGERPSDEISLLGIHFPSSGLALLSSSSRKYPGFAALPLLLPTNALFELSKDLILKVLNETIHEHEEQGMTSPSALDLGAHSSSCEWLLFLQCNTVNLSTEEIKTIESQLRQPSGVPHPPIPKIPSSAILFSPDCGSALSWSAGETIKIEKYYDQARSIAHLTSIITLCQIWVLISQMQRTNSPSSLSKLSIMTILLQTFIDGYLCIIALSLAIFVRPLFSTYITLAFFTFISVPLFAMRYVMQIYRLQNGSENDLSRVYTFFYLILLSTVFLSLAAMNWEINSRNRFFNLLIIMVNSYWVPQIFRNVIKGHRKSFDWSYILPMSLLRLGLPCSIYLNPENVLFIGVNYRMPIILVSWIAIQLLVLFIQFFLGPRFFLPRTLFSPSYDYHIIPPSDIENPSSVPFNQTCAICMDQIELSETVIGRRGNMLCPCQHIFHTSCLENWMKIRLICPTCRFPLPAL